MRYLVINVIYPKDVIVETPHEDEILDRSEFLAFLDFMRDQGFELEAEVLLTAVDGVKDVILRFICNELSNMADEEAEGTH